MTTRYIALAAAMCALAVFLSACGGGGSNNGSLVPSPQPSSSSLPSSTASTTFVFNDVSPNAGSVRIALQSVNGQPNTSIAMTAQIGAGAPGCVTSSTGHSCSVTVAGVTGTDIYSISSYQSTNASGSVLGTTTIAVNVAPGKSSTTQVSIGGVPAQLTFSPAKLPLVADGIRHRVPVTVNAADASGATIVGSTPYQSPVSLQVQNDPSHALTLSTTSVLQPGTVVTVTYDSSKPLAEAQILATDNGLQNASLMAAPLSINQTSVTMFDDGSNPQSVQLTETGFTGTFTATLADTTGATATVVNGTTGSGNAVVNLAPAKGVRFNTTTLTVGDGNASATIPIAVVPHNSAYTAYGPEHILLGPLGLMKGPDGRLWTADGPSGNIVAFNTTTHSYQMYFVDSSGQGPSQFAFDAAGNIWFADGPQIGELNPTTSTVTTYSTGLSAATPRILDIVAGPNGSNTMWFYDSDGTSASRNYLPPTYIGSIDTTTGQISEYQTPNNAVELPGTPIPVSMVLGPDGGLWFADGDHYELLRFDTASHSFTQHSVSTPSFPTQSPMALALGPDGNIWFTSAWVQFGSSPRTSLVGMVNLKSNDTIQTFNEGIVPGTFWDMIAGSDGNLWFTERELGDSTFTTFGIVNPAINNNAQPPTLAYYQYPPSLSAALNVTATQWITPQFAYISNLVDGGNGTLWTLDTNGGQIGEVTFK